MTDSPLFLPGKPLPNDQRAAQQHTLYHTERTSGQLATMTREDWTWQWRLLHDEGPEMYGKGTWTEMQKWLGYLVDK